MHQTTEAATEAGFWRWPAILVLSGLATGLTYALSLGGPIQVIVAFWFLLVCPGSPWVRLLRVRSRLVEWPLTVALSLALDTVVATTLVYTPWWSTPNCLLVLVGISFVGAIVLLGRAQDRSVE
jgi:hypothetical protein